MMNLYLIWKTLVFLTSKDNSTEKHAKTNTYHQFFCFKLEDFTPKKRLSGDLLLNLLLADHHLPFLSSFDDRWNSTSQRRSKMVGIEIAVLLLGEVKMIHIKNTSPCWLLWKMWMDRVIGEGLRCAHGIYYVPFCLVYSSMFCFSLSMVVVPCCLSLSHDL